MSVPVAPLLDRLLGEVEPELAARSIRVRRTGSDDVTCFGDPAQLEYGFRNLLAGVVREVPPRDEFAIDTAQNGVVAVQFAAQGVRANCIHPGFVETPMQTVRTSDPAWVEAARAAIPLGRLGTPRDVVDAALFLASDEASYITGAELVVDGGTMVV